MFYLLQDVRILSAFFLSGIIIGMTSATLRLLSEYGGWSVLF